MEMLEADDRKLFLPWKIQAINRCRLYLQVIFLSDIVLSDGKTIHPTIELGHKIPDRVHRWDWPHQIRPPAKDWNLFRKCIKRIWTKNNRFGKVEPALGQWVLPLCQQWKFVYSDRNQRVYELEDNRIVAEYVPWEYNLRSRRSRLQTYKAQSHLTTIALPEDAVVLLVKHGY